MRKQAIFIVLVAVATASSTLYAAGIYIDDFVVTNNDITVFADNFDDGDISGVMEVFTDITQVKDLQRQLTLMGRAVAGMAHRIKNIMDSA